MEDEVSFEVEMSVLFEDGLRKYLKVKGTKVFLEEDSIVESFSNEFLRIGIKNMRIIRF